MKPRERVLATLAGRPVDRPPVWMMRQAGRTLPEYRAFRANRSFVEVMRTPELACEVTLQPVRRFPVDVAILFSDILTIPAAMGQDLRFEKGDGPVLEPAVRSAADVAALRVPETEADLGYVAAAARLVASELAGERALFGFAGAPFTLACYMVEGGSTKSFSRIKGLMFGEPAVFDALMTRLVDATIPYLLMQRDAGVDAVQLFDTWAGELSAADYATRVAPHNARILAALAEAGLPAMLYLKNGAHLVEHAIASPARGLALDWRMPLGDTIGRILAAGTPKFIQGNLDPAELFAPPAHIRARVRALHAEVGGRLPHIFNLGHGLVPDTPLDGIGAFVDAVVELGEG